MANPTAAPIRNVVFDLGGVLIDWNPRHLYRKLFDGDAAAMEAFLATICTPAWNERQDAGRSCGEATIELKARHPEQAALIDAYYGRWVEMLGGSIEDTVDILEALRLRGTPLYALTNWSAETFPLARQRFAFLGHFRAIVVSGEIKMIKPDARIFSHLLDHHGLTASETLFIDDNPANVAGAERAGLQGHHFRSPAALRAELRARGLL